MSRGLPVVPKLLGESNSDYAPSTTTKRDLHRPEPSMDFLLFAIQLAKSSRLGLVAPEFISIVLLDPLSIRQQSRIDGSQESAWNTSRVNGHFADMTARSVGLPLSATVKYFGRYFSSKSIRAICFSASLMACSLSMTSPGRLSCTTVFIGFCNASRRSFRSFLVHLVSASS